MNFEEALKIATDTGALIRPVSWRGSNALFYLKPHANRWAICEADKQRLFCKP